MKSKISKWFVLFVGIIIIITFITLFFASCEPLNNILNDNMDQWIQENPSSPIDDWNNMSLEYKYGESYDWYTACNFGLIFGCIIGGIISFIGIIVPWHQ